MPTLNCYYEYDKSGHLVPELEDKFNKEFEANPKDYDLEDVKLIRSQKWYFMRFILNNYMNTEKALIQLSTFLKWRKSIGLTKLVDSDFPIEFYSLGALFEYPADKNGNPCLYIRVKFVKRIPELMEILKLFFLHRMNKIDEQSQGFGWVLIFDFTGATITNCDFELVNFLINAMCEYFPCGVDYILTYELPWILNAVWKIIRACIPEHSKNLVKCCDRKSIREHIDEENLPDFMAGSCKQRYNEVPKGCLSTEDFSRDVLGLNCKQVKSLQKFMDKFKPDVIVN